MWFCCPRGMARHWVLAEMPFLFLPESLSELVALGRWVVLAARLVFLERDIRPFVLVVAVKIEDERLV